MVGRNCCSCPRRSPTCTVYRKRGKRSVHVHRFHLRDAQPLGREIFDKICGPLVAQKPARLSLKDRGVVKLSRGRKIKQFLIGHAPPKEIGKARGEFVLLLRFGVINDPMIKKLGRDQDHGKGLAHRLLERIELRIVNHVDPLIVIDFLLAHRTPERPRHEAFDHLAYVPDRAFRAQR